MPFDLAKQALMYFVLPLWLLAGFADYLCHRATDIEHTAGTRESAIHLLMLAEVGIPIAMALHFEVNALVIAVMLVFYFVHEATAVWDVTYANPRRYISPLEQHVHNYLGLMPLVALLIIVLMHWGQFLALFGLGQEEPRFELVTRYPPEPWWYTAAILTGVLLLAVIPYLEELWRCRRVERRSAATGRRPVASGDRAIR